MSGKREAILLGCGTSTGVPLLGCTCKVCTSSDPRNRRLRTSLYLSTPNTQLLIDTSTDLREQLLTQSIYKVDAILFTHPHADHIHGIDDIRPLTILRGSPLPCYGSHETISAIRSRFPYIAERNPDHLSFVPLLEFRIIDGPFQIGDLTIIPIPLDHGGETVTGFRIEDLAYLTDLKRIPERSYPLLFGVKILFLGVLRETPHPKHLSVTEGIEISQKLGSPFTILVHMGHELEYLETLRRLPPFIVPGYDGMRVQW
jgi:phosphoribosyl 1,2-cyclic phosphate phosphodiesterase